VRVWGERNEKELCGQVSLTTLELKRLKVSLLQTSSDPLQCKSALCFSKKRNVVYINMGFPGGASGKERFVAKSTNELGVGLREFHSLRSEAL